VTAYERFVEAIFTKWLKLLYYTRVIVLNFDLPWIKSLIS
jgi:hypothetical protein